MSDATPRTHASGRSLVVIRQEGTPAARPSTAGRPDPAFLAHLLAVRNRLPAQRNRCRASAETAAAAYRSGLDLLPGDESPASLRLRA